MKYAVVILSGVADVPLDELDGATPLARARMPRTAELAKVGRVGRVRTTPPGWEATPEAATMCLLGYDPRRHFPGVAVLEAMGAQAEVSADRWVFRMDLVTVGEGEHSVLRESHVERLSDREHEVLIADVVKHWQRHAPAEAAEVRVTQIGPGKCVLTGGAHDFSAVTTTDPKRLRGASWEKAMPSGGDGAGTRVLHTLMTLAREVLADHEVNAARREQGLAVANMAWLWGQGVVPRVKRFGERFGIKGSLWANTAAMRGLGRVLGFDIMDAGSGAFAARAVDDAKLVCCIAGGAGETRDDAAGKIAALEAADENIIGPLAGALARDGEDWRMMVAVDCFASSGDGNREARPTPFVMAGSMVNAMVRRRFCEQDADASDLNIVDGHELMEYFLRGGLRSVRG